VLVLKKNPKYWRKGLPYLDKLTFKSVADTEAAYEAMLAGTGQAFEDVSSPTLAKDFGKHFTLTSEPSTSPYDIQLNTSIKPFTNITARKAICYATTAKLLDEKLFGEKTPVGESFEAPAGLFYERKVPDYIGYTRKKAGRIVRNLGGLSFTLFTVQNVQAEEMDEALQKMYEAAGMKVTIKEYTLTALVAEFDTEKWQIALQTAGAYTPATGVGVAFRFTSNSPFSGVHSPRLDSLLQAASGTTKKATRTKYYKEVAALIAKEAWGPFLFPINGYDTPRRRAWSFDPAGGSRCGAGDLVGVCLQRQLLVRVRTRCGKDETETTRGTAGGGTMSRRSRSGRAQGSVLLRSPLGAAGTPVSSSGPGRASVARRIEIPGRRGSSGQGRGRTR
jgi:ABC-type transport system substrate-binding protein